MQELTLQMLHSACSDDGDANGIRFDASLMPLGGPGAGVCPPTYAGGVHQKEKRWRSTSDEAPTDVIVVDNVPSQANRLEDALRRSVQSIGLPEFILDFGGIGGLPPHLPTSLSSLQFPHRHADAYLRDSADADTGEAFQKTEAGTALLAATPQNCEALLSHFPQSLLFGFWQSFAGKKATNAKHARAWVSEIIGWRPAEEDARKQAIRSDPLNLNVDDKVQSDENSIADWLDAGEKVPANGPKRKSVKLSNIGHGSILSGEDKQALAPVSFAAITQRATLSFAQLRRLRLGDEANGEALAAARALVAALGVFAHVKAFLSGGFCLRSGADLCVAESDAAWLSVNGATPVSCTDVEKLVADAKQAARNTGLALDGWDKPPRKLKPKGSLESVIRKSWSA